MYLEIFLADFAVFRVFLGISRVRDRAKYQKPCKEQHYPTGLQYRALYESARGQDTRDFLKMRTTTRTSKNNRFNKKNNNFARASHVFVHFFPFFARLRRENA